MKPSRSVLFTLALVLVPVAALTAAPAKLDKAFFEKTGTKHSVAKVEYLSATGVPIDKSAIDVPEDMIPDVNAYVSGGNFFIDGQLEPTSDEAPLLSFTGPVTVLMSREGGPATTLDTIVPEQSFPGKNRWWFNVNTENGVFFGRYLGNFEVPGTYQVTVRFGYRYAGNDFVIGLILKSFVVEAVDFYVDACDFGSELVQLQFHLETLFDVPEGTTLNFKIKDVASGNAFVYPQNNLRSSDAWVWIPRLVYDNYMAGWTREVEVDLLGRSVSEFQYFFTNLDACNNGGGKGQA
ncbi:MAG: hypothetical protein AAB460_03345 [Patescibacteria group bacterium]